MTTRIPLKGTASPSFSLPPISDDGRVQRSILDRQLIYEKRNEREKKEERLAADVKIWAEHSQRMTDKRNHGGL